MPNWCSNSLHFQGNPQRIAEVAEQILIKTESENEYGFSFNRIVPMPEELIFESGQNVDTQLSWLKLAEFPRLRLMQVEQYLHESDNTATDKLHFSVIYMLKHIFPDLKTYFSGCFKWESLLVEGMFAHFESNPEAATRFHYDLQLVLRLVENIRKYGHPTWYGWRLEHWGCKWNVDPDCTFVTVEEGDIWISWDTAWGPPTGILVEIAKRFPDLVFEARYLEEGMWFAGTYEGHEGALVDYPCTDDEVRDFAIEHFGCEYDDDD